MTKGGKSPKQTVRAARLGAALRENLKRRKAQARGRDASAAAPAQEPGATEATADKKQPRSGANGE